MKTASEWKEKILKSSYDKDFLSFEDEVDIKEFIIEAQFDAWKQGLASAYHVCECEACRAKITLIEKDATLELFKKIFSSPSEQKQ